MACVFAVGAFVQLNDPDPWLWILAYTVASGMSLAAALGFRPVAVNAALALVFALWFAALAPTLVGAPQAAFSSFAMQAADHEEPREAVGLLLLAVWSAGLAVWGARARRQAAPR
jgi:hypothetical protein